VRLPDANVAERYAALEGGSDRTVTDQRFPGCHQTAVMPSHAPGASTGRRVSDYLGWCINHVHIYLIIAPSHEVYMAG
jgi:hypothetical protein